MTTHLEEAIRTDIQIGSFPARKTQTGRIVLGAALAIVVPVAAIVMSVGTSSEVAPATPAIEVQSLASVANWAAPQTNTAGVEYSPANPYIQTQASAANWAAPQTNTAGVEYSPANPYIQTQASAANWAAPQTNTAGVEYSPANPYIQTQASVAPIQLGEGGPR